MSSMWEPFLGSNGEEPPRAFGLVSYSATLYCLHFYILLLVLHKPPRTGGADRSGPEGGGKAKCTKEAT